MPLNTALDPHHHNQFWEFVDKRQRIYYKRFVLKKPRAQWTQDKTLKEFFFTNVYRELDRGTLYLTKKIYPEINENSSERADADALFNTLVYRLFNHIPTWEFITKDWDGKKFLTMGMWEWKRMASYLKNWRKKGNQVFTSAFTVTGNRFGGYPDKIDNICWLINKLQQILDEGEAVHRIMDASSMEVAFNRVRDLPGFGAFLAYEIVIDLNYYKGDYWGENKFVNPGPGAKRGINHIFPDIRTTEDYKRAMVALRAEQREFLPAKFPYTDRVPRLLSLRNIEHSLCEYQKYVKRKAGTKRGRARRYGSPNRAKLPGSSS
jgi:hypothetical protein